VALVAVAVAVAVASDAVPVAAAVAAAAAAGVVHPIPKVFRPSTAASSAIFRSRGRFRN
jgi:hypothetical protein